jgi:hypothetical protein
MLDPLGIMSGDDSPSFRADARGNSVAIRVLEIRVTADERAPA